MQSLHEHIDANCLPLTLGGTLPDADSGDWCKALLGDVMHKGLYQ